MDVPPQVTRFRNNSLRNSVTEAGYKIYLNSQALQQIDQLPSHKRLQAERHIQSLSAVVKPCSTGRLSFQFGQNYVVVTRDVIITYSIHPPAVTVTSVEVVARINELPPSSSMNQKFAECRGLCHGNSGRGEFQPMDEAKHSALTSMLFSSTGAVLSAVACRSTRVSCGLMVVLFADAARQFIKASGVRDPIITIATNSGATEKQAEGMVAGADYVTAVVSINGAYKGLLMRTNEIATVGAIAATAGDVASTINTINGLPRATSTTPDQ